MNICFCLTVEFPVIINIFGCTLSVEDCVQRQVLLFVVIKSTSTKGLAKTTRPHAVGWLQCSYTALHPCWQMGQGQNLKQKANNINKENNNNKVFCYFK